MFLSRQAVEADVWIPQTRLIIHQTCSFAFSVMWPTCISSIADEQNKELKSDAVVSSFARIHSDHVYQSETPPAPHTHWRLTVCSLDVVAVATGRFHVQQLHGAVQQAVDHLETGTLVVENSTETPAVPRPHIWLVGWWDGVGEYWVSIQSSGGEHWTFSW